MVAMQALLSMLARGTVPVSKDFFGLGRGNFKNVQHPMTESTQRSLSLLDGERWVLGVEF